MCVCHQGYTALHHCADRNFIEGITALLEAKAQVDLQNNDGNVSVCTLLAVLRSGWFGLCVRVIRVIRVIRKTRAIRINNELY